MAKAFDGQTYRGNTWGVVVIKDGKIVAERYESGFDMHMPARTNSMCKSLAATVVGVGVKKGLVDIHKKAPLAEWRRPGDPRGQITLNDLLHMASGLYTEAAGDPQPELYTGGAAAAELSALNTIDSAPGTRFVYAGSDTILSVRAVRQAVNDDARFWAFPFEEILWKTGMTRTYPETDWNGDFMMSGPVLEHGARLRTLRPALHQRRRLEGRAHPARGLGEVRRDAVAGQSRVWRAVLGLRRTQRPSRRRLQPERRRRPVRR